MTFNEAIDAASVIYAGTSGISLQVAATSQVVPVVYSLLGRSADGHTDAGRGARRRDAVSAPGLEREPQTWRDTRSRRFVQFLFTTQP